MTPTIKINVVRKPVIKARMDVRFPAKVEVSNFLTVTKANGVYSFGVDYTKLAEAGITDPATAKVALLDASANVYKLVSVADILTGGLDPDLRAIAELTGTGILERTGDDTWSLRFAPTGNLVGTSDTQTLTNKTLTSPAITTPTGIVKGDVGLGNVDNTSDATKNSATATLTNKTISGASNTLTVREADLSTTDITTGNVSTTKHGFAPKLPNDATKFLDGTGAYSVPAGSGGSVNFTPFAYGGVGDGVADDTAALNAVFDAFRDEVAGDPQLLARRTIDLSGGKWRVTDSINGTGIVAWNWEINGGMIIGECTGKPILDLVGSRGYAMNSVGFYGSKTNMPKSAWQAARPTVGGFCDNVSYYDVATTGYYSVAAFHVYGQETALHVHGTYFNYNPTASVAILEGYSTHTMTSAFSTVMTGATSHVNTKFVNCDFRYLPSDGNAAVITGVTNASSGVITTSGHSFIVGDTVTFAYVGGMPLMQTARVAVTAVSGNNFTVALDTTSLGTYTSGGVALKVQTKPTIYIGRVEDIDFDRCYVVAYGSEHFRIAWPDAGNPTVNRIRLDALMEGSGIGAAVVFIPGSLTSKIQDFVYRTYRSPATAADFFIDTSSGGTVSLYGAQVQSTERLFTSTPLASPAASFSAFGADILFPGIANVAYASYGGFSGKIVDLSTGLTTLVNSRFANSSDGSFTPTVTASTGTITTVGTKACSVKYFGKMAFVSIDVTITTNGTGAGQLIVSLPFTAAAYAALPGRELAILGHSLTGEVSSGGTTAIIVYYDNTYPGGNGARVRLSGWVQIQ